jgi:RNA polymerase sigma-70 factor (ECF subfamily)
MHREWFVERRLVKKAVAGDREAAERLVSLHYASIVRFLLHLTGHINEAEELAQETFVKAWPKLGDFEGRSSLRTWLHRIAYREFAARRRLPEVAALPDDRCDERQNFLSPLVDALAVEHAIATLPDQLRITFILCHVENMSVREAAKVLTVPVGTVLSRLHTARERLRRQLAMGEIAVAISDMDATPREHEGLKTHEMSKAIL